MRPSTSASGVGLALLLPLLSIMLTLGASGFSSSSGSESGSTSVGWSVLPFATLSLSPDGNPSSSVSAGFHLPEPTAEDLERGYLEVPDALTFIARSNTDWQLFVHADESELGRSYDGLYVKPLSDLQLRARARVRIQEGPEPEAKARTGSYLPLSNEPQLLIRGGRGEWEIELDYRILLHRERYRPGDYQVTLVYTITPE